MAAGGGGANSSIGSSSPGISASSRSSGSMSSATSACSSTALAAEPLPAAAARLVVELRVGDVRAAVLCTIEFGIFQLIVFDVAFILVIVVIIIVDEIELVVVQILFVFVVGSHERRFLFRVPRSAAISRTFQYRRRMAGRQPMRSNALERVPFSVNAAANRRLAAWEALVFCHLRRSEISMPSERPFLTASWTELLMLNFAVPGEVIARLAPPGTEPDYFEGRAYVSVVGFMFRDARFFGLGFPGHQRFEEVNLRY